MKPILISFLIIVWSSNVLASEVFRPGLYKGAAWRKVNSEPALNCSGELALSDDLILSEEMQCGGLLISSMHVFTHDNDGRVGWFAASNGKKYGEGRCFGSQCVLHWDNAVVTSERVMTFDRSRLYIIEKKKWIAQKRVEYTTYELEYVSGTSQ